jgi:hypothetical protein
MIIVTGVGRSGTSFLARLYGELGFDPGGGWDAALNAGLEAPDVVRANRAIMWDLGVGLPVDGDLERDRLVRIPDGLEAGRLVQDDGQTERDRLSSRVVSLVPRRLRDVARGRSSWIAATVRATVRDPLRGRRVAPRAVRWDRYQRVVDAHRSRITTLVRSHQIVKDPRFCWTVGVWAAAGADIDHVLVCVRNLQATVDSRRAANHFPKEARHVPNTLVYGLGLCLAEIHSHRLDHDVVRFPDFLNAPEALFESMRFPAAVERERFLQVFQQLSDENRVHDWR